MNLRVIIREAVEEFDRKAYLAWKRKNVSFRGVNEESEIEGGENGGGAMLGRGLYTSALSNKKMSRQYGTVYFVINAVPKKPRIFNGLNDWEVWAQNNLYSKFLHNGFPDRRKFDAATTIEAEMQKMGYDGIIIAGREMVNYDPPGDVCYCKDESQVESYWRMTIRDGRALS